MLHLSALFALDAFAGGFVMSSFIAFWLSQRFDVDAIALGAILFGANLLAAVSALAAAPLAARFGLVRTMVFTHLPSNVLLMLVPLMPTLPLAALVLLVRFSISQMDVPTRQSYTMAIVAPDERSAAAGVTGHRAEPGRLGLAAAGRLRCWWAPPFSGRPVLHRRGPQDRLRPAPLPRLPRRPPARGAARGRGLTDDRHVELVDEAADARVLREAGLGRDRPCGG